MRATARKEFILGPCPSWHGLRRARRLFCGEGSFLAAASAGLLGEPANLLLGKPLCHQTMGQGRGRMSERQGEQERRGGMGGMATPENDSQE